MNGPLSYFKSREREVVRDRWNSTFFSLSCSSSSLPFLLPPYFFFDLATSLSPLAIFSTLIASFLPFVVWTGRIGHGGHSNNAANDEWKVHVDGFSWRVFSFSDYTTDRWRHSAALYRPPVKGSRHQFIRAFIIQNHF